MIVSLVLKAARWHDASRDRTELQDGLYAGCLTRPHRASPPAKDGPQGQHIHVDYIAGAQGANGASGRQTEHVQVGPDGSQTATVAPDAPQLGWLGPAQTAVWGCRGSCSECADQLGIYAGDLLPPLACLHDRGNVACDACKVFGCRSAWYMPARFAAAPSMPAETRQRCM